MKDREIIPKVRAEIHQVVLKWFSDQKRGKVFDAPAGSNLFNFHNTPLTVTLLDFIFKINGLVIECILKDKIKKKQYLFFLISFVNED